jgi:serine/threonine protein kinase
MLCCDGGVLRSVTRASLRLPLRRLMSAGCSQIVHRDVKAPNVLLREVDGCYDACISDFGTVFQPPTLPVSLAAPLRFSAPRLHCTLGAVVGVAKALNLADTVAQTGFKGTPAFMSPEQLKVPHAPHRRRRSHGRRGTPRVV